jgi:lipopolysaccharide transport system ATP-binding protein
MIAIKFENISKQYRLGTIGTGTLSHDLNRWWKMNIRGKDDPYLKIGEPNIISSSLPCGEGQGGAEFVWALRDINLEVEQGEVLGIIGKNGAGKSTLLKLLSRVTAPTTGRIRARGRIASLLEVGTGFHPEMTGRENIYMNGSIMGMTKAEINRKFDEIVDFAGVERYIDTPVKRYSSGMTVRLGFAIAAHLEPEILVVDEVLAVGDAEFQKKAVGKMQDVSRNEGRTVLFVSHNMGAIRQLCKSGLLLSNGQISSIGHIHKVISNYEQYFNDFKKATWLNINEIEKKGIAYIERIEIQDSEGLLRTNFMNSETINIKFDLVVNEYHPALKFGFDLIHRSNIVFRSHNVDSPLQDRIIKADKYTFVCQIPEKFLNAGNYFIIPQISLHCIMGLSYLNEPVLGFSVTIDGSLSDFHVVLNERNQPGLMFPMLVWRKLKN